MTRAELIEHINEIELRYPVEKWRIESMDIWPLIKIVLFFEAHKCINRTPVSFITKLGQLITKVTRRLEEGLKKLSNLVNETKAVTNNIGTIDILFAAPRTVRVNYNNHSYSRYFDPLADELEGVSSLIFEYIDFEWKDIYKKERVINAASGKEHYGVDYKILPSSLREIPGYEDFINEDVIQLELDTSRIESKIIEGIRQVLVWKSCWEKYLEIFSPKMAMGICYYDFSMFGLKLACQKFAIPFIDMQHGGQGPLHPAYTFASKAAYLNLLPDYFWLWDDASARHITKWVGDKTRIIQGGNPWLSFIDNNLLSDFSESKWIITYTLQVGLQPLIPDIIIEVINNTPSEFVWYIRFHPRMSRDERRSIYKKLDPFVEKGIVNISKANSITLPTLLNKSAVHISAFSGSINEAALLNVPLNITFSEIGEKTFSDLITEGKCIYFNPGAIHLSWWQFIEKALKKGKGPQTTVKKNMSSDYKKIFDELQENKIYSKSTQGKNI